MGICTSTTKVNTIKADEYRIHPLYEDYNSASFSKLRNYLIDSGFSDFESFLNLLRAGKYPNIDSTNIDAQPKMPNNKYLLDVYISNYYQIKDKMIRLSLKSSGLMSPPKSPEHERITNIPNQIENSRLMP